MDFLLKYGAIIDLREQCCSVMGKKFPVIASGDTCHPKTVTVQTDSIVQPRSEAIISGVGERLLAGQIAGMSEPSSFLLKHCNILVAQVVCNVGQGVVPVRVINA